MSTATTAPRTSPGMPQAPSWHFLTLRPSAPASPPCPRAARGPARDTRVSPGCRGPGCGVRGWEGVNPPPGSRPSWPRFNAFPIYLQLCFLDPPRSCSTERGTGLAGAALGARPARSGVGGRGRIQGAQRIPPMGALATPSRREGRGSGPRWGCRDPIPVTPSQPRVAPSTRRGVYGAVVRRSGERTCATRGNRGFLSTQLDLRPLPRCSSQPGASHQPPARLGTPQRCHHHHHPPSGTILLLPAGSVRTQAAGEGGLGWPRSPPHNFPGAEPSRSQSGDVFLVEKAFSQKVSPRFPSAPGGRFQGE